MENQPSRPEPRVQHPPASSKIAFPADFALVIEAPHRISACMLAMARVTGAAEGASSVDLIELKPAERHRAVGCGHAHLA
jgi:hypothetical protein